LNSKDKLYATLALGLYHRFRKDKCDNCNYNIGEYLEDPYAFEEFVALVMQKILGGRTEVTKKSGDGGVDIVHTTDNEKFLVQVKCFAPNIKVDYKPIAILHSNMVKENVKAGYFVTTSDYNQNAKKHAEGTNIKLINGAELAEYWLEHKQSWIESPERKSFIDKLLQELDKWFKDFIGGISLKNKVK